MSKHASHIVCIASPQGSAALSKSQKTFNRLIKKIEEQRKLRQAWQDALPRFRARQASEFMPLLSETDADERARKTTLMQRVNAAYEKNDLLALLQLQLEVEQIDHANIGALSESRLKHYNKVLTGATCKNSATPNT